MVQPLHCQVRQDEPAALALAEEGTALELSSARETGLPDAACQYCALPASAFEGALRLLLGDLGDSQSAAVTESAGACSYILSEESGGTENLSSLG